MSSSILDDLNEILHGKMYDGYIATICLWHSDHTPSLFIYPDTYLCKSCGKFGSSEQLLKLLKTHSIPHRPVVTKQQPRNPITRWINLYGSLAKAMYIAHKQLMKTGSVYLTEQRKITQATCKELGIGMMDGWYSQPIFNEKHQVIGCTARVGQHFPGRLYMIPFHQDPNMLYVTDHKRIKDTDRVYLTFGIYDSITLYQLGLATISTTTGKRLDPSALDNIRKPIYIIPDLGEEQEAHQLANCLGWRGRVLNLPDTLSKDVNELYVNDPQLLNQILEIS